MLLIHRFDLADSLRSQLGQGSTDTHKHESIGLDTGKKSIIALISNCNQQIDERNIRRRRAARRRGSTAKLPPLSDRPLSDSPYSGVSGLFRRARSPICPPLYLHITRPPDSPSAAGAANDLILALFLPVKIVGYIINIIAHEGSDN
ncbi:hypothetical protein EYF80_046484 [Liparis tanakae]|uniref:Uncharacterized protein n=1 Tax=Liparis tanakae TaxID=230148 RepID=A0A4Z2FQA9_9TELE|nr:hypothetical protein EYF80_046484 [Liparis tanakae]